MFKIVPKTNNLYEMSTDGEVRRIDGLECTLTSINNEPAITLVIYGKERTLSIEWLRLITHFEVDLKERDMFNIYFKDAFRWHKGNSVNKTMCFYGIHPEYKPGFRIIPNFTRYAISKEGEAIDTYTGEILKVLNKSFDDYLKVKLYSPDKNKIYDIVIHKLVALAWVHNPDPMRYYMCNHLDGNKHNPHYTNIEWTNHSGNNQHAFNNSLRSQNIECKIRDITDGKIYEFKSLGEACRFMNCSLFSHVSILRNNKDRLIKGKYQIKLIDDLTDWTLSTKGDKDSILLITVIDKNNKKYEFNSICDVFDYFGLINKNGKYKHQIDKYAKDNGILLEYKIIKNNKTIQVYELSTNIITNYRSILDISKTLNINCSSIRQTLSRGETSVTNGFAFRYKINRKWNTNFSKAINIPKCILAINKNGKEYECDSTRIAERLTKVNRKAIQRALLGITINSDWHFKYK